MKVFIYADELMYQGLHGIEDHRVVDCSSLREAEEIGREMSIELIHSYGELEDEYLDENGEFDEEAAYEDCEYSVWHIADEYLNMDNNELDYIAYTEGVETFVNKYCASLWED